MALARTTPTSTSKANLRGDEIISVSNDFRVTITVTVNQSSQLHQDLLEFSNSDRSNQTRTGGVMIVNDISTGRKITLAGAYIQTEPDEGFDLEEQDLAWIFGVQAVTYENPLDGRNLLAT